VNLALNSFGAKHGINWLVYNPIQMYAYHRLAHEAAPGTISAIRGTSPTVRSLVDVGAGSGAYAAEARRQGLLARACEHSLFGRLHARLQGVKSYSLDLGRTPPSALAGPFDLAYCFEVAEHLPPELGERLVEYLSTLAPVVVFSAAHPGQGGRGHINEQPPEHWIRSFARHGFDLDAMSTSVFRERLSQQVGAPDWLLQNTLYFSRRGKVSGT
jgi:hypothetical protein